MPKSPSSVTFHHGEIAAVFETYGPEEYDRTPADDQLDSSRDEWMVIFEELREFCEEEMELHPDAKPSAFHSYLTGDTTQQALHSQSTLECYDSVETYLQEHHFLDDDDCTVPNY
jgi:hypothetical protein